MDDPETTEDDSQFETFRDCLSTVIVEKTTRPGPKTRRRRTKKKEKEEDVARPKPTITRPAEVSEKADDSVSAAAEDLAEFTEYIADEAFESLPGDLRTLTRLAWTASSSSDEDYLQTRYALPLTAADVASILLPTLDPSVPASLAAYGLIDPDDADGFPALLAPVLTSYVAALTTAPPPPRSGKAAAQEEGCELCGRDWVPLSYHHLIPRFVHDKAVKRGWHPPEALQNVAWLCRLCHSFVHRFASHEDLARYYYTVDRLLEEEEVVKFARYASRVRWKKR